MTRNPSTEAVAPALPHVRDARQARDALHESEERHRLLFETSADGILRTTVDGHIRHANPAALAMFGRTEREMQGMRSFDLVDPQEVRLQPMIEERIRLGGARGELRMLRRDGSMLDAEVNTSTYRHADGSMFVNVVVRDVTDRVQLRRRLEALNDELSRRVREKTSDLQRANDDLKGFAHALAHDLRQPLTSIKAFCFALQAAVERNDCSNAKEFASRVEAACTRASDYVQALLSLAQTSQEPLKLRHVCLSTMAEEIVAELRAEDPSRDVAITIQPELYAKGDARLLRMLLQNLLSNAWKFTSRRRVAQVSLWTVAQLHDGWVYCVADNGAGFDMSRAEHLFGTFRRLHSESDFPGIGVGLANAQRIVLRHGGRIWAESCSGAGAAFFFTLNACEGQ